MDTRNTLKQIAKVFQEEETNFLTLTEAIKQFKELALAASQINMEGGEERAHLLLENGKAIGTTWAAMCLDDLMRTKIFVKGLFKAIEAVRERKKGSVNILYAGTGPFATLALPIMAAYESSEVQFTLLEINTISLEAAKKVIKTLAFEEYVKEFVQADATKYVIPEEDNFDIILSETMLRGLINEQQVPISMNLMKQVKEEVILVPEKISLSLALLDSSALFFKTEETPKSDYMIPLGELFELSKEQIALFPALITQIYNKTLFPTKVFELPQNILPNFRYLYILTEIEVFGGEKLTLNQSGLTTPHKLLNMSGALGQKIHIHYKIDSVPNFEYEIR
jgi:predicted RNA methylase